VAERMSDTAVRARLRDTETEPIDEVSDAPASRRRSPELLLGLLLIIGGALGGTFLFQSGSEQFVIVGTARALERGTVISRADLTALEVGSVPASSVVRADAAATLLGKRLLVDLPMGVPIAPQVVLDLAPLTGSEALIPLSLDRTGVPVDLAPGDLARVVISFPNRGVDAPPPELLESIVEVVNVDSPDDFTSTLRVTVRAETLLALDVARAERITVVKVAER
jgi:hypothetical protein